MIFLPHEITQNLEYLKAFEIFYIYFLGEIIAK